MRNYCIPLSGMISQKQNAVASKVRQKIEICGDSRNHNSSFLISHS